MKTIWKKHIKEILILSVFLLLDIFGEIYTAILFGQIIDSASSKNLSVMTFLIIKTLIFTIAVVIIFWLYQVYMKKFIYLMVRNTKTKVFSDIQNMSTSQFFKEETGNKISLLTNDMSILETDYFQSIILVVRSVILFIFSIITVFIKSYQIGIFLLTLTLISFFLPKFFEKKLSSYKKEYSDAQSEYTARISEYLNGFDTIKSFNITETVKNIFFNNADNIVKTGTIYEKHYNFVRAVSIFLGSLTFMGGFLLGGYLAAKGIISLGTMVVCIQLTNHITNPVYTFVDRLSSFKSVSKILEKIENLSPGFEKNINANKICKNLKKNINLESVNFSYENKEILKSISYTFEKNKRDRRSFRFGKIDNFKTFIGKNKGNIRKYNY